MALQHTGRQLLNRVRTTAQHISSSYETVCGWMERLVASFIWLILTAAGPAAAQESTTDSCGDLPAQLQAIQDFLTQVQEIGMAIAFSLAAVLLVYSGLLWMSGRPEKQEKARDIFVNVFVGLLIVVLAGGLVEWVKMTLCGGAA